MSSTMRIGEISPGKPKVGEFTCGSPGMKMKQIMEIRNKRQKAKQYIKDHDDNALYK